MTNEILAGALALAEKGYAVFPLAPGRNIPLIAGGNGHKDAVVDPAQIEAWWKEVPRANVGVSCVGAGILVVDVDPRNGGDESLRDLVEEHGDSWLDTVVALTPRGGAHYWYKVPDDARLRPGTPWPGIDIKVGESYVAVPPSKRSDGEYVWEAGRSPFDRELAPPPAWLLEALGRKKGGSGTAARRLPDVLPDGTRNSSLASAAGTMRRRGMTAEEMLPSLLELNKRGEPPLEAEAVEAIARSIGEYPDDAEGRGAKPTIASRLVELVASSGAELFRTAEGDTYLSVLVSGHRETYPLKGRQAETYIRKLYYDETASAVGNQPLADALGTLRAKAMFEGPVLPVAVRVGEFGEDLYVDLGNDSWDAVRIHDRGWEIVQSPPVRFRRPGGVMPLPTPVHGGSIERLRTYLNVDNDDDFRLLVTAMVTSLFATGPYVVTIFQGEQGSARSMNTRVIRALVDPNKAAVRTRPRDARDLMISATNAWMLAYDNLSGVSTELSDSICRLATRGRVRHAGALQRRRGGDLRGAAPGDPQRDRRPRHALRPARPLPPPSPASHLARETARRAEILDRIRPGCAVAVGRVARCPRGRPAGRRRGPSCHDPQDG